MESVAKVGLELTGPKRCNLGQLIGNYDKIAHRSCRHSHIISGA